MSLYNIKIKMYNKSILLSNFSEANKYLTTIKFDRRAKVNCHITVNYDDMIVYDKEIQICKENIYINKAIQRIIREDKYLMCSLDDKEILDHLVTLHNTGDEFDIYTVCKKHIKKKLGFYVKYENGSNIFKGNDFDILVSYYTHIPLSLAKKIVKIYDTLSLDTKIYLSKLPIDNIISYIQNTKT